MTTKLTIDANSRLERKDTAIYRGDSLVGLRGDQRLNNPNRTPNVHEVFRAQYGGAPNFMTPELKERGHCQGGRVFWELSTGRGIDPETTIWGVTVVEYDRGSGWTWSRHDVSRCLHSRAEAMDFIRDDVPFIGLVAQTA